MGAHELRVYRTLRGLPGRECAFDPQRCPHCHRTYTSRRVSKYIQVNRRLARHSWLRAARIALLLVALPWASAAGAAAEPRLDAGSALQARYAALQERLEQSSFPQPLYVDSVEDPGSSRGDVYAVVDYPIATVSDALTSPSHWCDVLILHLNVKFCHPVSHDGRTALSVAIGRKREQPLSSTFRIEFDYSTSASRPGYLAVDLNAGRGPLGTSNYRISFEAVGLEKERAFVHVQYSYANDAAARAAMQMYLATTRPRQGRFHEDRWAGRCTAAVHWRGPRRERAQRHALLPGH